MATTYSFRQWVRNLRPMIIENSSLPKILSIFAPIEVWAFSFGPFVWCSGEVNEWLANHETKQSISNNNLNYCLWVSGSCMHFFGCGT
jgi:hypothetical protein